VSAGPPGRLLSLDLWHTLMYVEPDDEERYMRGQVALACRVLAAAPAAPGGVPLPPDGQRKAFEAVYAEAVAASQAGRSVPPAQQIAEAGRRTGTAPDPQAYLDGLARLVASTPFQEAPDATAVLRRLRGDGWATAVVSNTVGEPGRSLRPVLDRMGFGALVDAFVFSDELPWTKPSPEIFREATRRVGVDPSRTVHVGDGWVDIEGARRAGFRAGVLFTGLQRYGERYRELFLPAGWSEPETPYRVASWPELPGVVESIVGPD
jgi:HAD superfamily hydrolase (TIGR01509 family)